MEEGPQRLWELEVTGVCSKTSIIGHDRAVAHTNSLHTRPVQDQVSQNPSMDRESS